MRRPKFWKPKLTQAQVREVRARLAAGDRQVDIAQDFGVRQQTISLIKRGETWYWLDAPPRRMSGQLDPAEVQEIRRQIEAGKNDREIARAFNVWFETISDIRAGRAWTWLEPLTPPKVA